MSKLSDYLNKYKIDARRLLPASKQLERLRPEDRIVRLAREQAKAGDEKAKELAAKPRRSGRPLSAPMLKRALAGTKIPRRARGRVVRAVNAVLAHKTKTEAKPTDLF
jgi:hypothetical protein